MYKYFIDNWDKILGVTIGYFSLIVPIIKFLQDKRKEERTKRFDNYHKLLDDLLGGKSDTQIMLDRQIAIVYELRNFKEYYPVTLRILNGLEEHWSQSGRLIKELQLTEEYIRSSKIKRFFYFRNK